MQIGIIGAGHIGGTLTRRFRKLGHEVAVANSRGPETLRDLASETGAVPVAAKDAVLDKDVVIVTIPEKSIPDLPDGLFDAARSDTVVVDTGNYYPKRDGRIGAIEDGTPESEWVSERLGRPVVKAFNNIYAADLLNGGRPAGDPKRIALPIAGDDPEAKALISRLINELGFDVVDAGSLDESWKQQPGTPVYTANLDEAGVRRALAEASSERPASFRA